MSDKTEFSRIVPLSIQEKVAKWVIEGVQDDVIAIFERGGADAVNKAYHTAEFRGRVMNIALTALFTKSVNEVTQTSVQPADSDRDEDLQYHYSPGSQDVGRQGGDEVLRRRGCHKFSAPNYAGRPIPQLRELMGDLIGEYIINRDIEWFSDQSRLIDAATQVAYSKGQY